jgi:Lipase (class 3)
MPTSLQKTMLALALFADLDTSTPFSNDYSGALQIYGAINDMIPFLNKDTSADWQVVWGPAVFTFAPPSPLHKRLAGNAIYVARNGTSGEYAVAIAGTVPNSLDDWLIEDYAVNVLVPWLFAWGVHPKPLIAVGTYAGLWSLLSVSPPPAPAGGTPIPGAGQTLLTFLKTIPKNGTTVYTTGHSLGGALSPTLALALVDMANVWNPGRVAEVYPFAFAGATPGDGRFSAYFRQRFPKGMQRIWNGADIVPHFWDLPHLEEVPMLYADHVPGYQPPKDVTAFVDAQIDRVRYCGYAPLDDTPAAFTGKLQSATPPAHLDGFLTEAVHQHIVAYRVWAGIDGWPWAELEV